MTGTPNHAVKTFIVAKCLAMKSSWRVAFGSTRYSPGPKTSLGHRQMAVAMSVSRPTVSHYASSLGVYHELRWFRSQTSPCPREGTQDRGRQPAGLYQPPHARCPRPQVHAPPPYPLS